MPSKERQVTVFEHLKVGQSMFVEGARCTLGASGVTRLNRLTPTIVHEELSISKAVTITDTGGANGGYGSLDVVTLPSSHIAVLGAMMDLTLTGDGVGIASDATCAVAMGTAAEAANDTLDGTSGDLIASTACALTDDVGTCDNGGPTNPLFRDATAGTAKYYLNLGVPDADISASGVITVVGTIHLFYIDLSQGEA